jgi:diadenosine tetraphosphatase ApaH/serine/threonine PP2A family protein phosphatase
MRSFIVGDVHGCLDELDELVALLDARAGDRFMFLGDYVDRGPDSVGVVRRVRELLARFPGSAAIAGNHEERALRSRERQRDGEAWTAAASDDDWRFLDGLPLLVRLPEHGALLVHAGIFPRFFEHYPTIGDVPAAWRKGGGKRGERLRMLLRVRSVDASGAFVGLGDERADARHWSSVYDGREGFCFFGHDPQLTPAEPLRAKHALGLDTGCCFGGRLSAAVLESGRGGFDATVLSVAARERYAEPRGARDE